MNKPVSTVLKLGSNGDDVKKVQARLIELGYSCGRTGVDGIFVSGTYVADNTSLERFVNVALGEFGYKEKGDNITKYGEMLIIVKLQDMELTGVLQMDMYSKMQ